jgi:hypothetical protein
MLIFSEFPDGKDDCTSVTSDTCVMSSLGRSLSMTCKEIVAASPSSVP